MEVDIEDLEFHEHAGGGAYGSVYKAFWKSRERIVAVKKLLSVDENELQVLSMLSHRNIVQFYCAVTKAPNFCLVTEFATKGSLYAYLSKHALGFCQILTWAREIALGVNYLHNEAPITVIHRDLKSKNVVIAEDMTAKICDFGCSRFLTNTTKMSLAGTFPWMAPEIIQGLPVSEKCDSFSYGVMLWELLTQEVPFKGLEGIQVAWLVVAKNERLTIPSSCPRPFSQLMERCWLSEPKERVSFREILDELQAMIKDDSLSDATEIFLQKKKEWRVEIEQTLMRLKKLEKSLNERERALIDRELRLCEREKELEQMAQLKAPEEHAVQSWSECNVFAWLRSLGVSGYGRDLAMYAQTFWDHNINGKRLLMLSVDDLKAMGILSVGHRVELLDEIDKLRKRNDRLLHFPPLSKATSPAGVSLSPFRTMDLSLEVGNYCRRGSEPKQIKWKMYLEVNGDDSALAQIQEVTFIFSKAVPIDLVAVHQPPFVMDKWRVGNQGQTIRVECVISYEGNIKKPRSTRMIYEAILGHEVPPSVEKTVQLQLKRASVGTPWPQESQDSGINVECGSSRGSVPQTPTASIDLEKNTKFQRGTNPGVSEMGETSVSYSHISKVKPKALSLQPVGAWSDKGNTSLALGIGPFSGHGDMKVQKWPMAKDLASRSPIVGMSTRNQKPKLTHFESNESLELEASPSFTRGSRGRKNSGGGKPRNVMPSGGASGESVKKQGDNWKTDGRRGKGRGQRHRQGQSESLKTQKNEPEVTDYRRSSSTPNPKK